MLDRIATILQHECYLDKKATLIVGVSGGPDSLCLLHALYQLEYKIIAVHVNHGLRPEADQESQQVRRFALGLGIDFLETLVDVKSFARETSVSIEEAARILRYKSLFEQARITKGQAVVVGHNADDQVETILMHIIRGTGIAGLRGMEICSLPTKWSVDIPLVRPLLTTWRNEIQQYLREYQLSPIYDSSNQDLSFFRNRIRHELLPLLQKYNPSIQDALLRMGKSLRADYSVLEHQIDKAWDISYLQEGNGCLAFRNNDFIELPISIQRQVLRRAIDRLQPGLENVDFNSIDRGINLINGDKKNSQTDLVGGIRLIKKGKVFWVANWQADPFGDDYPLLLPGETLILQNPSAQLINTLWRLVVEEIDKSESSDLWGDVDQDSFQAFMDLGALDLPLTVRGRKAGDQIKPLGLNGHSTKISDVMINIKLPQEVRDRWPLICSGGEIVWIPGYRVSELAQVKPGTNRVLHLRVFRDRAT
jgi:tRNA(Ile)-lysidine synthase